ncbi:MAG: peptidoglycan DD-metalloendopeptidase family protein [Fibrobacter sp.]|nr:peptidoglycan DD-metalloendopeptidase family protein [Fibrobacter sp.]
MKLFGFLLLLVLPFSVWSKEDNMAKNAVPLVDERKEASIEERTTSTEISETESEFSGNSIVDEADAGNVVDSVAESASNSLAEEIVQAEAVSEADSTDSEPEMSQEEADAELAADMSEADSVTVDSASKLILDMTTAFVPSASRRISAPYGIRTYRMHRGVDLGLCHGEDRTIVAAFTGVVTKVRNQGRRRGYGKYVILDHGNGLTTLYAHLASWQVNVGDTLQAGDTIGVGGNTGRSFGAHLHFEMRFNNTYIDPATVFNFSEGTFINAMTEITQEQLQLVEADYQKELSKHRYYKVRRGDCLGKIARKYGISITRLKQLNGIKGNMIRPGQVLRCS